MTDYLTVADLLVTHADLIHRYGVAPGVRDPGSLESAVFRPRTGYHAEVIEEAAALWESLSQSHPFIDGNERLAFAAAYTFLRANAHLIAAGANESSDFIMDLHGRNELAFEQLVPWLRKHARPIKAREQAPSRFHGRPLGDRDPAGG